MPLRNRRPTSLSRADRAWLLVAAGLLTSGAEPADCTVTLSTAAPRATCPLLAPEPLLATVPVEPLENSEQRSVDIRISVLPAKGAEVVVQSVSLYPVDHPARFVVRLPPVTPPARLVLTLLTGPGRLAVRIGPVGYRYQEPH